ncbi:MAG: hypothetical protein M3Q71_22985 [Chloroflexota bacterium]|nr:hypothetical protein [Chloroflexota bacterium]
MGNRFSTTVALTAALGLSVLDGSAGLAQDATPEMASQPTGMTRPAHIHRGTCDSLDPNPLIPLTDVGITPSGSSGNATPVASPMAGNMMAGGAIPVEQSITEIPVPIADILAAPHAINVHESAQNVQNYIACGTIGGTQFGDTLMFGLQQMNNSGFSGVALLSDNGQGGTNVLVYLVQGAAAGGAMATPTS